MRRPMTSQMIAYHFVGATLRDGRQVPPDGEWLEHSGTLVMCESGLHASPTPFEALQYAPGNVLCEVEMEGCLPISEEHKDKLVASRRRIIRRMDLEVVMFPFARQCALDVAHLWKAPQIVLDFLNTGDESLRDAAWAAARAAGNARDAAWAAAWDAAGAAGAAQSKRFNGMAMAALEGK